MRLSFTASVLLSMGLLCPVGVSLSAHPEDLEGSGYDVDSSGSGDGSELVSLSDTKTINEEPTSKDGRVIVNEGNGDKNAFQVSSGQTFDNTYLPARDAPSGFVVLSDGKSFMDTDEMHAAIIAGGVTGVITGVTLSAMLIYKWKKKDEEKKGFR